MNTVSTFPTALRLACAASFVLAAGWASAQAPGRIKPAPQPVAPALPAPGTLGPGSPNPAGLASRFPAGLPSPLPNPAGLPPPTPPNLSAPGVAAGSPPVDFVPQANVMGAGAYSAGAAARPSPGMVAGPYTALQIAQSFIGADFNRDGELTRAEAQRLSIVPYSFEEMDRNRDGILTRFEYEDAVR